MVLSKVWRPNSIPVRTNKHSDVVCLLTEVLRAVLHAARTSEPKGINKNTGSLNSVAQKFKQAQIRCRQCEKKPRPNSCNCNCELGHAACASCVCVCARFACGRIFLSNKVCALSVHIVDPADVAYRAQHRRQSCQNNSHAA